MTDLTALLERVRAATGADREIDAALMAQSYAQEERHIGAVMEYSDGSEERVKDLVWVDPKTDKWVSTAAHSYTASIDAALALIERMLPGWVVDDLSQNSRLAGDPWGCQLGLYHGTNPSKNMQALSGHDFPTAPLAILAATLSALIAQAQP